MGQVETDIPLKAIFDVGPKSEAWLDNVDKDYDDNLQEPKFFRSK